MAVRLQRSNEPLAGLVAPSDRPAPTIIATLAFAAVLIAAIAGVDVVVVGKYASGDQTIMADQLQTKCPSKYKGSASPAATSQTN